MVPLTKVCGLARIAIQKPLDILVPTNPSNFVTEAGKVRLAEAETDMSLKAEHWAPRVPGVGYSSLTEIGFRARSKSEALRSRGASRTCHGAMPLQCGRAIHT